MRATMTLTAAVRQVEALDEDLREPLGRAAGLVDEPGVLGRAARAALRGVGNEMRSALAVVARARFAAERERERAFDRLFAALEGEARRAVRGAGLEAELALARAEAAVADRIVELLSRERRSARRAGA